MGKGKRFGILRWNRSIRRAGSEYGYDLCLPISHRFRRNPPPAGGQFRYRKYESDPRIISGTGGGNKRIHWWANTVCEKNIKKANKEREERWKPSRIKNSESWSSMTFPRISRLPQAFSSRKVINWHLPNREMQLWNRAAPINSTSFSSISWCRKWMDSKSAGSFENVRKPWKFPLFSWRPKPIRKASWTVFLSGP